MAKSITAEKFDNNCWKLNISIPKGSNGDSDDSLSNILKRIKLISQPVGSSSTDNSGVISYNNVQLSYAERGPVGKAAASTLLPYQDGFWISSKTYKKTATTVPYVSHNGKYYLLIVDSCTNKKPGTTSGQSYWEEMTKYNQILTKFLIANNAVFGSSVGSVIHNNFLFSQLGEDPIETEIRYSNLEHGESGVHQPFNTTEKTIDGKKYTISELTGKFIPNTSINFFNGTMSCNKLSEKFETFDLIDVNTDIDIKYKYKPLLYSKFDDDGYPDLINQFDSEIKTSCKPVIYNYTHFITKDGSFNINVSPRIQFIHKKNIIGDGDYLYYDLINHKYGESAKNKCRNMTTNIFDGFFINGTIVLPDPDKDNIIEGTHIFINNPNWLPGEIDDYKMKNFIKEKNQLTQENYINSITGNINLGYLNIINPKSPTQMDYNGYVMKNELYEENIFTIDYDNININDYYHSSVSGYVLVCADPNIFDKSKYTDEHFASPENSNCFLWNGKTYKFIMLAKGSILKLRSVNLTKKYISYDTTSGDEKGKIIKTIGKMCVREKNIGTQWIIENTSDFSELTSIIRIVDFNNNQYYDNPIYKFNKLPILGSCATNENIFWTNNPEFTMVNYDGHCAIKNNLDNKSFPFKTSYNNFSKKSIFDNSFMANKTIDIGLDINTRSSIDNLIDFDKFTKDSNGYYDVTGGTSADDILNNDDINTLMCRPESFLGSYNKLNSAIGYGSTNIYQYGGKIINGEMNFTGFAHWGSPAYINCVQNNSTVGEVGVNTLLSYNPFTPISNNEQQNYHKLYNSRFGLIKYCAWYEQYPLTYSDRGIYLYDSMPMKYDNYLKRYTNHIDIDSGQLSLYNIRGVYKPHHIKI